MADPLTIVGGVIGILSSLTSLSTKINDFRQDVQGAKSEIRDLAREAEDLALVLGHLKVAKEQGIIAYSLEKDLGTILQRLGQTVSQTEGFLKRCKDKKRTVGMYWAFTGKSQCLQLCRRLESYKSTINVTLTLSSVLKGYENHGHADGVLNSIGHIRRQLADTRDDYVLERYLMEMETVYEGSTVADVRSIPEVKATTRTPSLENIDGVVQFSDPVMLPRLSTPPLNPSKLKLGPQDIPRLETPSSPPEKSRHFSQTVKDPVQRFADETTKEESTSTSDNKRIAEHWMQSTVEPTHVHQFRYPDVRYSYHIALTSRDGRFAACMKCLDGPYGVLICGLINKRKSCIVQELDAASFDPPAAVGGSDYKHRVVLDLALRSDGALIAALDCWDGKVKSRCLRLFLWYSVASTSSKAISPVLPSATGAGTRVAISRDCRRIAVCEDHQTVVIRDIADAAALVCKIKGKGVNFCHDVAWTHDSRQILVTHASPESYKMPALSVFDATNGSCIVSTDFSNLSLPRISWLDSKFFALGGTEVAVVNWFGTNDPSEFTVEETSRPASEITRLRHFIARLDLESNKVTPTRIERDRIQTLRSAVFSPDGSCAVVQPYNSGDMGEVTDEGPFLNSPLCLYDTLSGERISRIPYRHFGAHYCFDHDGRMVMAASTSHGNMLELSFLKAAN